MFCFTIKRIKIHKRNTCDRLNYPSPSMDDIICSEQCEMLKSKQGQIKSEKLLQSRTFYFNKYILCLCTIEKYLLGNNMTVTPVHVFTGVL